MGFPGVSVVKDPSASARATGEAGLILGLGRSPGGGNGNPLRYSCLGSPMDEGPGGVQSIGWHSDKTEATKHT